MTTPLVGGLPIARNMKRLGLLVFLHLISHLSARSYSFTTTEVIKETLLDNSCNRLKNKKGSYQVHLTYIWDIASIPRSLSFRPGCRSWGLWKHEWGAYGLRKEASTKAGRVKTWTLQNGTTSVLHRHKEDG